jgi:hypothetical protein
MLPAVAKLPLLQLYLTKPSAATVLSQAGLLSTTAQLASFTMMPKHLASAFPFTSRPQQHSTIDVIPLADQNSSGHYRSELYITTVKQPLLLHSSNNSHSQEQPTANGPYCRAPPAG